MTVRNTPLFAIGPLVRITIHRIVLRSSSLEIERVRHAMEPRRLARLGRHGIEQEAQAALDVLAVNAAILLEGCAAAVVDDAEQHRHRRAATEGIDPAGLLDLLEVGMADVELPERVAVLRLKAHRGRCPRHVGVIVAPEREIPVHRRAVQNSGRRADLAVGRLDAVLLQQLDGARGGEMPALLVRRADLQRRDDLAEPLHLRLRHLARCSAIRPPLALGPEVPPERPVDGGARHAEEGRSALHQDVALGVARRQMIEAAAQVEEGFGRDTAAACPGAAHRTASSSSACPGAFGEPSPLTYM